MLPPSPAFQGRFGFAVALNDDGSSLFVGCTGDSVLARGVNGVQQSLTPLNHAGAVYMFVRSGATWIQQVSFRSSSPDTADRFGNALAASSDTLAVGMYWDDSSSNGLDGDATDNAAPDSGACVVFSTSALVCPTSELSVASAALSFQSVYFKPSNPGFQDNFGRYLTLDGDGLVLVVAAPNEDSGSPGINGNQLDESKAEAGAVYVFSRTRASNVWNQGAYIKAANPDVDDSFGSAVSISANGKIFAVGAPGESAAKNAPLSDNSAPSAGAVYVFRKDDSRGEWVQEAYLKASNALSYCYFGSSVSLSDDGNVLVVGALLRSYFGGVYVFARLANQTWVEEAFLQPSNRDANDRFGFALQLSGDGKR